GGFPAHTARFRLEDTVARRREKDSIIGIGGRRREGDDRTIDWRNRFGLPNAPTREPFGGYARQHRTEDGVVNSHEEHSAAGERGRDSERNPAIVSVVGRLAAKLIAGVVTAPDAANAAFL